MASNDIKQVVDGLTRDGEAAATRAFRQGLGNVESIAKDLCPVGHYGRARGKAGKAGGDLRQSLRTEFIGKKGKQLVGRCASHLPYAGVQHEVPLHHPGLYTGAAGEKYAAKFFERGVEMIFGIGKDPLGKFSGSRPATFQELLREQ